MGRRLLTLIPVGIAFGSLTIFPLPQPQNHLDLKQIAVHLSVIHAAPPAGLTFAGVPVPLDQPHVSARLESELKKLISSYESTASIIRRSARYQEQFVRALRSKGIPDDFYYLALAESNLSNAISPAGASGIWQFMPATAERYGLVINDQVDERYHPEKATAAACRYFKDAYRELGDWTLVAAAYNMGAGGIMSAVRNQGTEDYFSLALNRETGSYLYRVLAWKCILEHPARYGFSVSRQSMQGPVAFRQERVAENIADLSSFAAANGVTLDALRAMNPWLIGDRLDVRPGTSCEIRIPRGSELPSELLVNASRLSDPEMPEPVASASAPAAIH